VRFDAFPVFVEKGMTVVAAGSTQGAVAAVESSRSVGFALWAIVLGGLGGAADVAVSSFEDVFGSDGWRSDVDFVLVDHAAAFANAAAAAVVVVVVVVVVAAVVDSTIEAGRPSRLAAALVQALH